MYFLSILMVSLANGLGVVDFWRRLAAVRNFPNINVIFSQVYYKYERNNYPCRLPTCSNPLLYTWV